MLNAWNFIAVIMSYVGSTWHNQKLMFIKSAEIMLELVDVDNQN